MATSPADLNRHFTQRYSEARAAALTQVLKAERPTILRLESELVFLHQNSRRTATLLEAEYHELKAAAHMPAVLSLFALQSSPPTTYQLADLRDELALSLGQAEQCAAVREALGVSRELLDAWLEVRAVQPAGAPPTAALSGFRRQARLAIAGCIQGAARAELRALHGAVSDWTRAFARDDWRALKVVICASHQARYRESTKEYFKRLLAQHGSEEASQQTADGAAHEQQVIYAENCATEAEALRLLAAHHVDRELAGFVFGAAGELQRDVIGDTFVRLLDEWF